MTDNNDGPGTGDRRNSDVGLTLPHIDNGHISPMT